MEHTVNLRPVSRTIPARPDGTSRGYRVDYPDGRPRVTYDRRAVSDVELSLIVDEVAAKHAAGKAGRITDDLALGLVVTR